MHAAHFVPVLRHTQVPRPGLVAFACAGEPALVMIRGSFGMGKTSVAVQIAQYSAEQGAAVVWVAFPELGAARTGLWVAIVRALEEAGVVPRGELPEVLARNPTSPIWQSLRTLSDQFGRLMIVVDNFDGRREPAIEPYLLAALEALPSVHLVLAGAHLGSLDQGKALHRVPVRLIEDSDLLFSAEETEALIRLRLPAAEQLAFHDFSRLASDLHVESGGWPLAAHSACTELATLDLSYLVLPEWARFRTDFVNTLFRGLAADEYDALLITAVSDEISDEMLARLMQIDRRHADRLLRDLAARALMQRRDGRGVRWFRHHEQLRHEVWSAPRIHVSSQRARGQYRSVAVALSVDKPEAAASAALRAEDWPLMHELMGRSFTEQFLEPNNGFAAGARSLPEEARRASPIIDLVAQLVCLATPLGRTPEAYARLRETARYGLARESGNTGVLGICALGLRLRAAWHVGDAELCRQLLVRLRTAFATTSEVDRHLLGWAPIAAANIAALASLGLEEFDAAEYWLSIARAIDAPGDAAGNVHTDALAALVAAWRGDMPTAAQHVDAWERKYSIEQWSGQVVAMPYLIAKAFVQFEANDVGAAYEVLQRAERSEHYIDLRPYLLCAGGLILRDRYGASDALAWMQRHLLALGQEGAGWVPALCRAPEDLVAAFRWLCGKHPARGEKVNPGFAAVYVALTRGEWEEAWSLAAALGNRAAETGFIRRQVRALSIENAARQWAGQPVRESSLRRADLLALDYGLRWQNVLMPGLSAVAGGRASFAAVGGPGVQSGIGEAISARLEDPGHSAALEGLPVAVSADAAASKKALARAASGGSGSRISGQPSAGVVPLLPTAAPHTVALTTAELRALEAVARWGNAVRAAAALNLSPHTVRDQLKASYRKLGVHSREDALREVRRLGLIAS